METCFMVEVVYSIDPHTSSRLNILYIVTIVKTSKDEIFKWLLTIKIVRRALFSCCCMVLVLFKFVHASTCSNFDYIFQFKTRVSSKYIQPINRMKSQPFSHTCNMICIDSLFIIWILFRLLNATKINWNFDQNIFSLHVIAI